MAKVSVRVKDQKKGGLWSGPCTVLESKYVNTDFNGSIDEEVAALYWRVQPLGKDLKPDVDAEEQELYWSAGSKFTASKDGSYLDSDEKTPTGLNDSTNFAIFMKHAVKLGIDDAEIDEEGPAFFEGKSYRMERIVIERDFGGRDKRDKDRDSRRGGREEREGQTKRPANGGTPVIVEILDIKPGKKSKKSADVEEEAPAKGKKTPAKGASVEKQLTEFIAKTLSAAKDGKMALRKVLRAEYDELSADPNHKKMAQLLADTEEGGFISEGPWDFDPDTNELSVNDDTAEAAGEEAEEEETPKAKKGAKKKEPEPEEEEDEDEDDDEEEEEPAPKKRKK